MVSERVVAVQVKGFKTNRVGLNKKVRIVDYANSMRATSRKVPSDPLALHQTSSTSIYYGLRNGAVHFDDLREKSGKSGQVARCIKGKAVIGVRKLNDGAVPFGLAVSALSHEVSPYPLNRRSTTNTPSCSYSTRASAHPHSTPYQTTSTTIKPPSAGHFHQTINSSLPGQVTGESAYSLLSLDSVSALCPILLVLPCFDTPQGEYGKCRQRMGRIRFCASLRERFRLWR